MAEPFRPSPRFAKTYLRVAAKAEANSSSSATWAPATSRTAAHSPSTRELASA